MQNLKDAFNEGLDALQKLTQKKIDLFEKYSNEEYLFMHQLPAYIQVEAKRIEEEKLLIKKKLAKLLGCEFHPDADLSDFLSE